MKKKRKTGPSILDPEGKTIFDEVAFRAEFKSKLISFQIPLKRPLLKEFSDSLANQFWFGRLFLQITELGVDSPYITKHLHFPWENAKYYALLNSLFFHLPAFLAPFISKINQYFYMPVLDCWRATQAVSCFKQSSDYCARALPGTTKGAGERALSDAEELLSDVDDLTHPNFKAQALKGYSELFDKRWDTFKGSLFPLGYKEAANSYGRLTSIPGSTLCNINKLVKTIVLEFIFDKQGFSFMEVDLKSAHAKIFEDLFDWRGYEREDLPELNKLWPIVEANFWDLTNKCSGYDSIIEKVRSWEPGLLKGLLKNQFYKALNGGMPDFSDDNLERSRTKLKISKAELPIYIQFFNLIFSQMNVFRLETAFQIQINSFPFLYLPNRTEHFGVKTPSKSQLAKQMKTPGYEPRAQTANSRLFSNMELCLIFHLVMAITEANVEWLVVGYEADGILVCGRFNKEQAVEQLARVQASFSKGLKKLTTADHTLDIKNLVTKS